MRPSSTEPTERPAHREHWSDPSPESYATGHARDGSWRFADDALEATTHDLIEEVPIALVYGTAAPIVTMATPLDAEDLARGFALTERIVDRPDQIIAIDAVPANGGLAVFVELAAGLELRAHARRRVAPTTGACGLCGIADPSGVFGEPVTLAGGVRFTASAIFAAFDALPKLQRIGQRTGSAHGAAFADADGRILAFAEDAGRHNALDKVVGRIARLGLDPASGFCAVTSRASFEMTQKAAMAGLPMLCAISAPTALAVRLAKACDLTLCAFVRERRFVCFSAPQRLQARSHERLSTSPSSRGAAEGVGQAR